MRRTITAVICLGLVVFSSGCFPLIEIKTPDSQWKMPERPKLEGIKEEGDYICYPTDENERMLLYIKRLENAAERNGGVR